MDLSSSDTPNSNSISLTTKGVKSISRENRRVFLSARDQINSFNSPTLPSSRSRDSVRSLTILLPLLPPQPPTPIIESVHKWLTISSSMKKIHAAQSLHNKSASILLSMYERQNGFANKRPYPINLSTIQFNNCNESILYLLPCHSFVECIYHMLGSR